MEYYVLAGKVCAKALFDTQMFGFKASVPVHFSTAFYKKLLGLSLHWQDFEIDDPSFFRSKVKLILDTTITEDLAEDWDLSFSVTEKDSSGRVRIVDLKPHGQDVMVTEESKMEYLEAVTAYRFDTSVAKQFSAFYEGFKDVLGEEIINHLSIFDHKELELLLCGVNEIDLADWQAPGNVRYFGCNETHQVVQWFWIAVMNMTNKERCQLIQFITGSSQGMDDRTFFLSSFFLHLTDDDLKKTFISSCWWVFSLHSQDWDLFAFIIQKASLGTNLLQCGEPAQVSKL